MATRTRKSNVIPPIFFTLKNIRTKFSETQVHSGSLKELSTQNVFRSETKFQFFRCERLYFFFWTWASFLSTCKQQFSPKVSTWKVAINKIIEYETFKNSSKPHHLLYGDYWDILIVCLNQNETAIRYERLVQQYETLAFHDCLNFLKK